MRGELTMRARVYSCRFFVQVHGDAVQWLEQCREEKAHGSRPDDVHPAPARGAGLPAYGIGINALWGGRRAPQPAAS
jgi:hypothetical protein